MRRGFYYKSSTSPVFSSASSVITDGANDYLDAGTPANLNFTAADPFWLSIWWKVDTSKTATLIGRINLHNTYDGWKVMGFGTGLRIYAHDTYPKVILRKDALLTNGWHHLLVSYSGGNNAASWSAWYDGAAVAFAVDNDAPITNMTGTAKFLLGAEGPTGDIGSFLATSIHHTAVGTGTKDGTDATAFYNGGNPIDMSGVANVVSYWMMGDGPGDGGVTIVDQVGSNDITLVNGAAITADAP